MGKWTSSHYDAILNAKIKSLVSGAITRSKLEKTDPVITYETFVDELDAGDSFTTSVVEILVKELAERQARNSISDRRLIADRTAKRLKTLAMSVRTYRDRRRMDRRLEHLASPPAEMGMQDDEDEFDTMLSSGEGIRVNTELYDAYGGAGHAAWASAMFHRRGSPSEERTSPPPPQPPSPPMVNTSSSLARILASAPSSTTNLSRQPSIRRSQRPSRTVDFNDFSSRRRNIFRDATVEEGGSSETGATRLGQRRFFHIPRYHHRFESWASPTWVDDDSETRVVFPTSEPSPSSGTWIYPIPLTPTDSTDTETPEERVSAAPRLRRGGIRPPESMLSRHVSPFSPVSDPPPPPIAIIDPPVSMDSYPTPGPVENEATP